MKLWDVLFQCIFEKVIHSNRHQRNTEQKKACISNELHASKWMSWPQEFYMWMVFTSRPFTSMISFSIIVQSITGLIQKLWTFLISGFLADTTLSNVRNKALVVMDSSSRNWKCNCIWIGTRDSHLQRNWYEEINLHRSSWKNLGRLYVRWMEYTLSVTVAIINQFLTPYFPTSSHHF